MTLRKVRFSVVGYQYDGAFSTNLWYENSMYSLLSSMSKCPFVFCNSELLKFQLLQQKAMECDIASENLNQQLFGETCSPPVDPRITFVCARIKKSDLGSKLVEQHNSLSSSLGISRREVNSVISNCTRSEK